MSLKYLSFFYVIFSYKKFKTVFKFELEFQELKRNLIKKVSDINVFFYEKHNIINVKFYKNKFVFTKKYAFGKVKKDILPYKLKASFKNNILILTFFGMYFDFSYLLCVMFPIILIILKVGIVLDIIIIYYFLADFTFNMIIVNISKKIKEHFLKNFMESI